MGPFGVSILHAEVSAAVKKASDKTASKIIVTDLICLIYILMSTTQMERRLVDWIVIKISNW
jgi:hypothetical protein